MSKSAAGRAHVRRADHDRDRGEDAARGRSRGAGLHAEEVLAKLPPKHEASKVFPFMPRETVVTRIDQRRAAQQHGNAGNVVQLRARPAGASSHRSRHGARRRPPTTPHRRGHLRGLHIALERRTRNAGRAVRAKAGLTERLERIPVAALKPREREAEPGPGRASSRRPSRATICRPTRMSSTGPRSDPRPPSGSPARHQDRARPAEGRAGGSAVLMDTRGVARRRSPPGRTRRGLYARCLACAARTPSCWSALVTLSGEAIAAAEADKLCADVLTYAASAAGQRLLRNGDPPDIEKIKGWLEAAQSVRAA